MRHRIKKTAKLGRKPDHRQLLLRNLATSLILKGKIQTTAAKAKAVQAYLDRLIANIQLQKNEREIVRQLKSKLLDKQAQKKVLAELKQKYAERKSGFTRITALGIRPGDGATKVQIELV